MRKYVSKFIMICLLLAVFDPLHVGFNKLSCCGWPSFCVELLFLIFEVNRNNKGSDSHNLTECL